jgi:hypothetical protein
VYAKLRLVSNLLASQRWTAVIPAQEFVNLSVETHSSGLLCAWICDWAGPKIDFFTNSQAGIQQRLAVKSCHPSIPLTGFPSARE